MSLQWRLHLQVQGDWKKYLMLLCAIATASHVKKLSVQAKRNSWRTVSIEHGTCSEANRQITGQPRVMHRSAFSR